MKTGKGKPFASVKAAQGTFLEILMADEVAGSGDILKGLRVSTTAPGYVHFEFVLVNRTFDQTFWSGPYPDSQRYTNTVPIRLKHQFRAEILDSNNQVVAAVEPELADAGEDVALDYPYGPTHEASQFDGFWISPRYANLTTENNAGPYTETGGQMTFPVPIADGSYTLRITVDPIGLYNQGSVANIPFTLANAVNIQQAAFKSK